MGKALRVTVTIPEDIVAAIDSVAKRTRASRSKVITHILDEARRDEQRKALAEGYQVMSAENAEFAESAHALSSEVWPEYKSGETGKSEAGE